MADSSSTTPAVHADPAPGGEAKADASGKAAKPSKKGPKPAKGGGGGGGAAKKPTKIKEEVFLVMCMATSGRTPQTGSVLSLAACGITAERKIVGVFHRNILPRIEAVGSADAIGFWHGRPHELAEVTHNGVPAREAFRDLLTFCAPFGKCTLVGTPILSIYPFLQHHLELYCSDATSMPWGFSGLCARSFASGVLGVSMKELAKHPEFIALGEDMEPTGVPVNDCIHGALYHSALLRRSLGLEAKPVEWACDKPSRGLGKLGTPVSERVTCNAPLPFLEYPSITDPDFDPKRVFSSAAEKEAEGYEGEWVATEKVHGSNLSFITDGKAIRAAKRTGLLTVDDAKLFFQFDHVLAACEEGLLKLHAAITEERKHTGDLPLVVTVFGEIAGGEYRHSAVVPDLNGRRVQHGVQYAPNNFFYPFDVAFATPKGKDEEGLSWIFVPFDEGQALLAQSGFPTAKILKRCASLKEVLEVSCEFPSTLPEQFGLPPLDIPNFAEGLVVRPAGRELTVLVPERHSRVEADSSGNTSSGPGHARVMIKVKHPLFREFVSTKAPKDAPLVDVARGLVTRPRVDAVLSKYDAAERKDIARMARLVAVDALKDAEALREEVAADGEARDKLLAGLQQLAMTLVETSH